MDRPSRIVRSLVVLLLLIGGVVFVSPSIYRWGAGRFWARGEREIHLLPKGYEGPVVIVFDPQGGVPREYEGKARLYRIPANGILRTQFAGNKGWGRPRYYWVDSLGGRDSLLSGPSCEDTLSGDPVRACTMNRKYRPITAGILDYQAYVVGHRANRLDFYGHGRALIDSLIYGLRPARPPN